MANSQIFHGENTFVGVSLNHKCFILASLLIIQSEAIPVDKFKKYIVTTVPYSTVKHSFDHRINYAASIGYELKKLLSNETIKNCNRSEEYITNYNGLNHLSNECKSSNVHVTRVNILDKHSKQDCEIKNKLSNKTGMNYNKSEENIKNYSRLNNLNNKRNRSDVYGTRVIKSNEQRIICYASNESKTKYSEVNDHSSKCTRPDKLNTILNLSKQSPYITSINNSQGLSLLTQKIYGNVLNATSFYSSLLNNNSNLFQFYEKKTTINNDNKIPHDILKKYIAHYIWMKIKSIIAHTKFKNERESRQCELNRHCSLICGVNESRNVKHPNGLKELKTMSGKNRNKKKRFVVTKPYSNSDVFNDTSNNNEVNSRNSSSYRKSKDLDHINNSSLIGNLSGNKSLASTYLNYSIPDNYKDFKISSDLTSKDRHFMAKHSSKYCRAMPKIESSISKPTAMREVEKINLDTNFDEADSFQVEKLMNMDNPQLLNLVKSLIDREINNNLEDIKVYNGNSGQYDRPRIINPNGYRPYPRPNTNMWFRDQSRDDGSRKKNSSDSYEPNNSTTGQSTTRNPNHPTVLVFDEDPSNEDHDPIHGDKEEDRPIHGGNENDLPPIEGDIEEQPPIHGDHDEEGPGDGDTDHGDSDHGGHGNGSPDRGPNDPANADCQPALCKKTAMTLVITFLSTLVGVLILVFIIFYLWKRCCSPKAQIIYAQPCYEACC